MYSQANRGRKCDTVLPKGTIAKNRGRNEEKTNTGSRSNEPATSLAIGHTMTNSSRKQQHSCCGNNSSIATRRVAVAAAALCMHVNLTSVLLRRHLSHDRTYWAFRAGLSAYRVLSRGQIMRYFFRTWYAREISAWCEMRSSRYFLFCFLSKQPKWVRRVESI